MAGAGMDTTPIAPTVLIVPTCTPASTQANAVTGSLVISGGKLILRGTAGWELVTSVTP